MIPCLFPWGDDDGVLSWDTGYRSTVSCASKLELTRDAVMRTSDSLGHTGGSSLGSRAYGVNWVRVVENAERATLHGDFQTASLSSCSGD